jgi:hypothetical protein
MAQKQLKRCQAFQVYLSGASMAIMGKGVNLTQALCVVAHGCAGGHGESNKNPTHNNCGSGCGVLPFVKI